MDRLAAMSVLVAVVESGSLSAAARKLRVPLPTVSRRISELEAHLGTRLLLRTTRRLALTDSGATYLAGCRRILEQVAEVERVAAGEFSSPKGELAVTAPIVFGRLHVLPIVTEFLAKFPDVDVRLALSDRNVDLVSDHVDLAVRIGALPDSGLTALSLGSVRRMVCGSPAFFAAHGVPKRPEDLAGLPAVVFDAPGAALSWPFMRPGSEPNQPVAVRARLSVNTAEAAIDAAIAGVGVTRVLSYQVAAPLAAGRLRVVLADFEDAPLPVQLVHPGQQPLPLKLRVFLDFAAPRLRRRLGEWARAGQARSVPNRA